MKLYEVKARRVNGTRQTRYFTRNTDAMRMFREHLDFPGTVHVQANLVELRTNLVAADWIALLESDAPGMQGVTLVPGELITSRKVLKESHINA
jgi:hypothetical protein